MTPDQIRALPASWYSSQPIPRRLLVDLGRDLAFIHRGGKVPRRIEGNTEATFSFCRPVAGGVGTCSGDEPFAAKIGAVHQMM